MTLFLAVFVVIPAAFILPNHAFAGIFSVFKDLFAADKAQLTYTANSQTLALLEPAKTATPATGGAEVSILEGSALDPDTSYGGEGEAFKPKNDEISIYVVREGDTLSDIADMFEVSAQTIMWANDMSSKTVKPGQTLVILPVSGVRHTVAKGDTISTIAKKYKGDAEEIADFNHMDLGATLAIGAQIIIPDGEITAGAVAKSSGGSSASKPTYSGYFARPLSGGRKTQGIHGFNAVDIAAPTGTAVYASAGGRVIVARSSGWNGGYGAYVVIAHDNGTQTLYAHLSEVYVSGGAVSQGETIGAVGNTGKSTGAHLHFEVRGATNPF
ncbi:MAG: hypothetical protein COV34_03620 [Candidatus Zambryskibacteria bacterium CG10_big_fil_rev_8_21_14_0_10_42_12]|uniref:LysM domain-containing protein n=1 Tax=Candidatus Zambryskibacteria bacterium CG10_big_fil_rev_8_21_14_0_10_42_12 TaxID=1975115 RepID=A0A2H0QSQ5_9BACT|nr:MAG: hypothetical protein COV34_03620 [Candidatus Zambryskibacteria bacterium CG10_big_fil_rev_8_21_14_0_10_42_12]